MSLQVSRILHAGYLFECAGTRVVFDPIFENPFSRNCHAFPPVSFDREEIKKQRWDAVFISHFHDDHCSLESLDLLHRDTPIYMFCVHEDIFDWIRDLGFRSVTPLRLNHPYEIGSLTVTPRRALDADVDSIFQIEASGLKVLNVVDAWIDPDMLARLQMEGPWDLILWPFQTMREMEVLSPSRAEPASGELPEEWIEQLRRLKPRFLVPSSCQFQQEDWSWYNQAFFPVTYAGFAKQVGQILPQTQVMRLNPGVSIHLQKESIRPATALSWIQPVGEQNLDYRYAPELKAPPTAEIALRFEPLSEEQMQTVDHYCREVLPARYRELGPFEEGYFREPRSWRLSVYDHRGQVQDYHYRVDSNSMCVLQSSQEPASWTTEVPVARLFGAIQSGESLTSMYVRINDGVFCADIEDELKNADLLEDPLVVALFSGTFGSYQRAQLAKLKSSKGVEK